MTKDHKRPRVAKSAIVKHFTHSKRNEKWWFSPDFKGLVKTDNHEKAE